jgi:hypothetical protein
VLLILDHARGEPLREERTEAAVARVVLSRVVAVQPLHRARELLDRALDDCVVVRRHQAPGLEPQPEPADRPAEMDQEEGPVEVVPEERRLGDAPRHDVEVPVGETRAEDAPHPTIVAAETGGTRRRASSFPLPARPGEPRPVSDTRRGSRGRGLAGDGRCQTLVMARRGRPRMG